MESIRYEYKDGGKYSKYLPNDLHISIMCINGVYALTGDAWGITEKTWKTLKGAQRYMEREYPNYVQVSES